MSDFYSGEGRLLRVIKREGGRALVVDCLKKTMPEWVGEATLGAFEAADESADAEAGVAAYAEALEALGYTPFADSLNGGAAFTKETTLDDGVHTFYVEAVSDGYLILVFFDMANIDNL